MKIDLNYIRNVKTFDELKPAIILLCNEMQKMTWGEFNAFKRTIENKAKDLNISLDRTNEYAENYQIFGKV